MKLLIALCPLLLFATPVTYEHLQDERLSIHILEVNPEEADLKIVNCDSVEKTSVIAHTHGAIAAVNGGFFQLGGCPSGILKIAHVTLSETDRSRGALGWHPFVIDRLNSDPESGELLPLFHPENSPLWESTDFILGTTPVLVIDGIIPNFEEESVRLSFLHSRFSRTAFGIKEDGHLLFVMVEGPQSGISEGMTIAELADFMLSQGCRHAINFCGGHSSTLYFNEMVVHSSLVEEKPVGNVVIIKDKPCQ